MPSWAPSESIRRTRGTRIASLMRVVSRFDGRTCSTGRRLGLKCRSPSWAYSSPSRFHAAARSSSRSTRFEPHASSVAREVRNGSAPASQTSKGSKLRHEIRQAERELAAAVLAHREALVGLAVAEDDHVRDLLELGGPDPLADRLGRRADVDPVARLAELEREGLPRLRVLLSDGQDAELQRREPEGEGAGVVLGEDADETLERAEQRAVHDDRGVLPVVGAHVREPEALRHLVVELDRPHLPRAAERVGHVQVDLRSVEGALPGRDDVLHAVALQRQLERRLGAVPLLVGAEALLRPGRELRARLEPEEVVEEPRVIDDRVDLLLDLVLGEEDVRVVLRDVPDAQQAVEGAGELVAVERRRLRVADRQVAIRPELRAEEDHVAGAVHRLERELLVRVLLRRDEEDVLRVVLVVTGGDVRLDVVEERRLDLGVAAPEVLAPAEILERVP